MIDLKQLREDPQRFKQAALDKNIQVDVDRILELDSARREAMSSQEAARSEQKSIGKKTGPQIGALKGRLKSASDDEKAVIEQEIAQLEQRPQELKEQIQQLDRRIEQLKPELDELLLKVPQPAAEDVPRGRTEADNIEILAWNPEQFDPGISFRDNRGFDPRTHIQLLEAMGLVDFERAVKVAGSRHYVLRGDGMRLSQAILRYAFEMMVDEFGFTPMSVPVIVRENAMIGTGFFPSGRDQAYHVEETRRGSGEDLYLTGTGEVGLMSLHADEILDIDQLPLKYTTVSTCFRREAGAAGKDTAGLYRIHQFDKVEQVVICEADPQQQKQWHQEMIGYVQTLLQRLELPYRLLQCCTGDLGPKNEDMIDIECWMPGRGEPDSQGHPTGQYGETHSASRLGDFQCRRLNLRYRENGRNVFCYSLNNTVAATPRLMIPIIEMNQQEDGSIRIPQVLRPYMGDREFMQPS